MFFELKIEMKKNIIIGVLVATNCLVLVFAFMQKQKADNRQTQVYQIMRDAIRQQEEAQIQLELANEATANAKGNAMAAAYEVKAQRELVSELQKKVK